MAVEEDNEREQQRPTKLQPVDPSLLEEIDFHEDTDSGAEPAQPFTPRRGRKRRFADLEDQEGKGERSSVKGKALKSPRKPKGFEEKRTKRFRSQPPGAFQVILDRALTQRMFVLDRTRSQSMVPNFLPLKDDPTKPPTTAPSEVVTLAGSTGNIYIVNIAHELTCSCPHAMKGNQCKHVVYVLNRVLKAPFKYQYQLAFLSCELEEIFAMAPPINPDFEERSIESEDGRKEIEEGDDCPICCVEFSETKDPTVWCKAGCGNNMHKSCFGRWVVQKKALGSNVTCPFCRTPWQVDDPLTSNEMDPETVKTALAEVGKLNTSLLNEEGYINIGDKLGLSGERGSFANLSSSLWRFMGPFTFVYSHKRVPLVMESEQTLESITQADSNENLDFSDDNDDIDSSSENSLKSKFLHDTAEEIFNPFARDGAF